MLGYLSLSSQENLLWLCAGYERFCLWYSNILTGEQLSSFPCMIDYFSPLVTARCLRVVSFFNSLVFGIFGQPYPFS